jgi:hypothetical protein
VKYKSLGIFGAGLVVGIVLFWTFQGDAIETKSIASGSFVGLTDLAGGNYSELPPECILKDEYHAECASAEVQVACASLGIPGQTIWNSPTFKEHLVRAVKYDSARYLNFLEDVNYLANKYYSESMRVSFEDESGMQAISRLEALCESHSGN